MRSNYWTCSKFADWIRGTTKLGMGTAEEWHEWKTRAKRDHPIRWWIAEEGLDKIQNFIMWPLDKIYGIKYYINNRWITRTHALTAHPRDVKPGEWRDVGNRFLPCLFNELVDFVEVELAWWHLVWAEKEERAKYKAPWWRFGWWNMRLWRCPQAGLDNLEWQRKLVWREDEGFEPGDENIGKPTPQAVKAQEILDLYNWWTQVYRNRLEPMDASGWSAYCDACRDLAGEDSLWATMSDDHKSPELKAQGDIAHEKLREIEEAYEKEDEEMMIRLIKVRHGLWT